MVNMFKEMVEHSKYLWVHDRKEFWDGLLSFILVAFWMWFTIFVLLPLFSGL